jgi:hypothetical protein
LVRIAVDRPTSNEAAVLERRESGLWATVGLARSFDKELLPLQLAVCGEDARDELRRVACHVLCCPGHDEAPISQARNGGIVLVLPGCKRECLALRLAIRIVDPHPDAAIGEMSRDVLIFPHGGEASIGMDRRIRREIRIGPRQASDGLVDKEVAPLKLSVRVKHPASHLDYVQGAIHSTIACLARIPDRYEATIRQDSDVRGAVVAVVALEHVVDGELRPPRVPVAVEEPCRKIRVLGGLRIPDRHEAAIWQPGERGVVLFRVRVAQPEGCALRPVASKRRPSPSNRRLGSTH